MATPSRRKINVPNGHILVHEKWKSTELGLHLIKQAHGIFSDGLDFVDFYISDVCPVVYVTEADFVLDTYYENKLRQLKELYGNKGLVLVVRNNHTIEQYNIIQEFSLLELDLFVLPVGHQMEIPFVLHKMAINQAASPNIINKKKPKTSDSVASQQIAMLSCIPRVGGEKAKQLLNCFGNISAISQASEKDLAKISGAATGEQVYNFFHKSMVQK